MIDTLADIVRETWFVLLEASPWLVLGLLFAGLVRSFLPGDLLTRLIGKSGPGGVVKASLFGAPLPLCSCGVLPTAIGLRRQGLSKPATVSFLIATPQNGVDSLAISYSMLGLPFTIARLVCSLISSLVAGMVTWLFVPEADGVEPSSGQADIPSCCESPPSAAQGASCCEPRELPSCCETETPASATPGDLDRSVSFARGQRYAFGKLYSDLAGWLMLGILIAGVINAFVSPQSLAGSASGLGVMLLILLISIPMYICATASTPVAASMLMAGISPGAVLVFLLAGPATNIAGIVLIQREIGTRATAAYLGGLIVSAVGLGLLLDGLAGRLGLAGWGGDGAGGMLVPHWLAVASAALLVGLFIWHRTSGMRRDTAGDETERAVSLQSPVPASEV
jgi:uncharacterized membrane protein YraQ (UPF0718 family)